MDPVRPAKGRNEFRIKVCSKILTTYRESHTRNVGLRYKVVQMTIRDIQVSQIKDGIICEKTFRVIYTSRGDLWNRCCTRV